MSKEQEAAFAEREAAIKTREEELARKEAAVARAERETRHAAHVAFAEKLADEGKLLPAFVQKVAGALDALAEQPAEASFAEGSETKTASALDIIKDVLSGAPKIVAFGEHGVERRAAATDGAASFAAPSGFSVDAEGLETLERARAYQAKNPNVSFVDAVKAVGGK